MPSALWLLMRMRWTALARRLVRGLRTPRGLIFGLLGGFMLIMWLGPALLSAKLNPPTPGRLENVWTFAPLVMLGFTVLSLLRADSSKAIVFSPAEIDFLFPGPFTRRQLLIYKLTSGALGLALGATIFGLWAARFAAGMVQGYVTVFLGLVFLQLIGVLFSLVGQAVAARAFTSFRRVVVTIVVALAALAITQAVMVEGRHFADQSSTEIVRRVSDSFAGTVLLAPFRVFAAILTAQSITDFLRGTGLAAAMLFGLLIVILRMDANYLEASLHSSQRLYERVSRIRRGGGGVTAMNVRTAMGIRVPPFPFLAGVGPIAWRQMLNAARHARGLVIVTVVFAGICGMVIYTNRDATEHMADAIMGPVIGWLTFMLPMMFRFDFRGDLDHLPYLKTLPLRPVAVAAGQLIAPLVILSALDFSVVAVLAFGLKGDPVVMRIAALAIVPLNLLLLALENFFFLLYPLRQAGTGGLDFQVIGRNAVVILVRMLAVAAAAGLATAIALLVLSLTQLPMAAAAAGSFTLLLTGLATIPAVAWAFARFDPALDTPA